MINKDGKLFLEAWLEIAGRAGFLRDDGQNELRVSG